MKNKKLIGAILLSLAASIWGGMFVVVKIVVIFFPPITLGWLRYTVALLALLVIKQVLHQKWDWHKQDLPLLISIGIIGNLISIVTQETGTWLTTAQLGSVITASTPTFMLIFGALLLKEHLNAVKIGAVMLATTGIIFIVGVQPLTAKSLLGVLCLVGAALTWALMSVLIKKVPQSYTPLQVTTIATLTAWIGLTPLVGLQAKTIQWSALQQPPILLGILYLGVISTAVAFVMWNQGLQLLNAASSGLFFAWQPLAGTLLGWLLLAEPITGGFIIGSALVVLSIWVNIRFGD